MANSFIDSIKKYFPVSVKSAAKNAILELRAMRGGNRVLPDMILIGVQKAGTASLFYYLIQHEQVVRPIQKQTFYFSERPDKSMNWYRSNFPTKQQMSQAAANVGKEVITLEATPDYILYPHIPPRLAREMPNVKLVCILRNPVSRAISEFFYFEKYTNLGISFDEKMKQEMEAFQTLNDNKDYQNISEYMDRYTILLRGLYDLQIKEWFKYFSKEQILFLSSEEFFKDKNKVLNQITSFMNISSFR
ncbi:MAG: sulfotransferase domain-containing protein, partial [Bacteroidota bacterium]